MRGASFRALADIAEEFHTFVTTSTARILIFTGGSSTSGVDMVRQTLTDIGAEYIFGVGAGATGASGVGGEDSRAR